MAELPDGIVTFLSTDVEGSTPLWEEAPDSMMDALRLHDGVIGTAVAEHNGVLLKLRGEGDSQFAVFSSAVDAVGGSAQIQRDLANVDWPTPRPLRVRGALHTGPRTQNLGTITGLRSIGLLVSGRLLTADRLCCQPRRSRWCGIIYPMVSR